MIVRPAVPDDVATLVALVRDLAAYEGEADAVQVDEGQLASVLFADVPTVFAHVAEEHGEVAAMAIWFLNYSTWTGRNGIYIEDLFVRPGIRGRGFGRALLAELAAVAVARGYARVDWSVLDWNEPALRFYRSLGARPMDGWTGYRLDGTALLGMADGHGPLRW